MHKKLYLIRHSYAEGYGSRKDFDRTLTAEGQRTLRALSRHLEKQPFEPDKILCSPAKRTTETTQILLEELRMHDRIVTFEDALYNASPRELLFLVNQLDTFEGDVAIVGHNPSISYFGEFLTAEHIGTMEPASMVTIHVESAWSELTQGSADFIGYFHPFVSKKDV